MSLRRTWYNYILAVGFSISLWINAGVLFFKTSPTFGDGTIAVPGQPEVSFKYPFVKSKLPRSKLLVKETLFLQQYHPTVFAFYPQDVLWTIKVNGQEIHSINLPLAIQQHEGHSINLSPYLHPGVNQLEFGMEDLWKSASLNTQVSPWDPWSITIFIVLLAALGVTLLSVRWIAQLTISWSELTVVYGGLVLQATYLLGTPCFLRSYDLWGHIEYIQYLAKNLRLPKPHSGWETFQAPLYYIILGLFNRLGNFAGIVENQLLILNQGFSFLCTGTCLIASFFIGRQLFPGDANVKSRLYFLAIIAVFPSLLFNASRISNDVLLNPLMFLWLFFLIWFWREAKATVWMAVCICVVLALLTKTSALSIVPVSAMCLFLSPRVESKRKWSHGVTALAICFCFTGWYYIPKLFHESGADSYVVGNIHYLNPKSRLEGTQWKTFVFNPFKVLRYPFVFPWGPRRDYFLEYFFKSAFVGEWWLSRGYIWIARFFMAVALLSLPVILIGLKRCVQTQFRSLFPLIIMFGVIFCAQACFVQVAPYMSTQDFRYSVILIIPLCFFMLTGCNALEGNLKIYAFWLLRLMVINCAVYIVASSLLN